MDIYFTNRQLSKTCASEARLVKSYGSRRGRIIAQRLGELRALPTLDLGFRLPHLGLHQLSRDRDEQFAVTVVHPWRLVFEPADDPAPRLGDGGLDLPRIVSIVVLEIVDYH